MPKPNKPPLLKFPGWTLWLERQYPYVAIGILVALFAFRLGISLFRHGTSGLLERLATIGIMLGIILVLFTIAYCLYKWLIAPFIEDPPPAQEKLPSAICPHCNYDLRATLLRCPECGHDTPFKLWLDQQNPLERALYEQRLKPRMHEPPTPNPPSQ